MGLMSCSEILPQIKPQKHLAGTKCSNGSPVIDSGAKCSNWDNRNIKIMPSLVDMPPPDRRSGAADISGGTECVDDWNPGDCRSNDEFPTHPGISQTLLNKEIERNDIANKSKEVDIKDVVVAFDSMVNADLANENTYVIRSKTDKLDMQSHLQENLSTALKHNRLNGTKDDIRNKVEVNDVNGCLMVKNDEKDENEKSYDDENDDRDEIKGRTNVRAICDKFEGRKRMVKRNQIRLSPKSKSSPLLKVKRIKMMKRPSNTMKTDPKEPVNVISPENTVRKTATNNSKVGKIIAALENNIEKGADVEGIEVDEKKEKKKVENAFKKLMNANNRGDITPSPGSKKRRKRIGSLKSHGTMKLDDWLMKEK